jgi:predicted transcriptional regulator
MSADNPQEKNAAGKHGMSTLDLLGGSASINRVVKFMLHKNRMSYQELCDAVDNLPPDKRMSREELDTALAELVEREWLGRETDGGELVYQVVLRPKLSSAEQLHSDNLPQIDVAVDKNVNPNLNQNMRKKGGFADMLRGLFGVKK